MSADYARIAANATRTLQRSGRSWQIRTTTSANAISARTAVGVKIDETRHVLEGSRINIGDHRMLFMASANPVIGERLTADTETRVIVHTEAIQPADVVCAWWVWARAG